MTIEGAYQQIKEWKLQFYAESSRKKVLETIEDYFDAVPVLHGHWIHTGLTNVYGCHQHKCSVCGYELMVSPMCDNERYCCNCGAKMDEEGEQE